MSYIVIRPLHKHIPGSLDMIDPRFRKAARQSTNSILPVIFVASFCVNIDPASGLKEFDIETTAALGFRYRRQSHSAEITWWGGSSLILLQELAKVMIYQAILEGRKRVECSNEQGGGGREKIQVTAINKAFEYAGYSYEGTHPDYTPDMEDVNIYAHIWLEDGIPQLRDETYAYLVNNGYYTRTTDAKGKAKIVGEGVKFYAEKNLELYEKDRDLYRVDKSDGLTFAEHIRRAQQTVKDSDNIKIIENWPEETKKKEPYEVGNTVPANTSSRSREKITWDPSMGSNRK